MTAEDERTLPSNLRILAAYRSHDSQRIHGIVVSLRADLALVAKKFPYVGPADDLIQDALKKIMCRCARNFDPKEGRFGGWAVTVARNLYIDKARRLPQDVLRAAVPLHGTTEDDLDLPVAEGPPPNSPDLERRCLEILSAAEPDSRRRDAFLMRFRDGRDWDDIAAVFEKARSTVQGWVTETHKRLRHYCDVHDIRLSDLREGADGALG